MLQSLEALMMVEPENVSALISGLPGDPLRLVGESIAESLAKGLWGYTQPKVTVDADVKIYTSFLISWVM